MNTRIKQIVSWVFYLCLISQLFACALIEQGQLAPVSSVRYYYQAVGFASVKVQKGKSHQEKVVNAIKVSKLHAFEELTEHIHGVLIKSNADIKENQLDKASIVSFTQGLVKGAKVKRTYHYDDIYITELELEVESSMFESDYLNNGKKVQGNQVYY